MDRNSAAVAAAAGAERFARAASTRAFYATFTAPEPAGLTDAQRRARQAFDLDAAMASLPTAPPQPLDDGRNDDRTPKGMFRGAAGTRLRPQLVSNVSDALLREFATTQLKAKRMSKAYLDALRVVLGNQAHAAQWGYTLELNLRVSFASERTMRTIIDQMADACMTKSRCVGLGPGRSQVVQVFSGRNHYRRVRPEVALEDMRRSEELANDRARALAPVLAPHHPEAEPWGIPECEVPY